MAKLTFVLEDGQEVVVPLAERITLGRAEDNDVVVDDDRVSKHHAELVRNADGSVQVFDSNSTAGTFVNGERVRSSTARHGDRLSFGPLAALLDLEEAPPNGRPVKGGRIAARKKDQNGKRKSRADTQTVLPPDEMLARHNAAHLAEVARLEMEKARLQAETDAMQKDLREWQQRSEKERAQHNARVESLRAEEERLVPLKAAVLEAETAHAEWMKSIVELAGQHAEKNAALLELAARHDQKSAALRQLHEEEAVARREIEGLAAHREQTLAHLQQIRVDCAHDEAALDGLRRELAETSARAEESRGLAEVREDQVRAAEKRLEQLAQRRAQIEAHVAEIAGAEEKLVHALARCREEEAAHAALSSALNTLGQEQRQGEACVRELESRILELKQSGEQMAAANQDEEESLRQARDQLAACEKTLAARKIELEDETRSLEEAKTRRAEIERQCVELAGTERRLADVKNSLGETEKKLAGTKTAIMDCEARVSAYQTSIKTLEAEDTAAKGRVGELRAREKDLRTELAALAASERVERARFEEVRQLAAEAEKEHAAQRGRLEAAFESRSQELEELVSRLTPLRDWKDAMDLLYARLAALPQDSPEARDLWHEIEKEKAGLHNLITTARMQAGTEKSQAGHVAPSAASERPGKLTGSILLPGGAQEATLRARLAHLRENVQREEARIEQLRLERIRHEGAGRSSPAADAMLREQARRLETRMRQEEERYHALQRTVEVSQAEEEKRRERLAEMEHRLAELRADIAEAERQRSTLRQQADLVQTELRNHEAALERVTKKPVG